jgi:hypothetical protein
MTPYFSRVTMSTMFYRPDKHLRGRPGNASPANGGGVYGCLLLVDCCFERSLRFSDLVFSHLRAPSPQQRSAVDVSSKLNLQIRSLP